MKSNSSSHLHLHYKPDAPVDSCLVPRSQSHKTHHGPRSVDDTAAALPDLREMDRENEEGGQRE